jgi:hypothetical protein
MLMTQRPAALSKNVLSQIDGLVAKTTVCEVTSTSISDNITAFTMKVRLHNNQETQ